MPPLFLCGRAQCDADGDMCYTVLEIAEKGALIKDYDVNLYCISAGNMVQ